MDQPLIEIKNLSKDFGAQVRALNRLNLKVFEGCVYGIMGMSGAGKSTLLRCLTGLDQPTSGSIYLKGKELTIADLFKWRQEIGMVFQHFQLFSSRNVFRNIAYPLEIRGISFPDQKNRVAELLKLVGLEHKAEHFPNQLSGGEKQRVGIARALAHHPCLLLCDEPTSALDSKTTHSILELLQKLNRELGLTIIMITHQLDTIKQICQRVAVLSKGEIVEEGSVKEVFTAPKHSITRQLLHFGIDQIPSHLLQAGDPSKRLIRLGFEGENATQPIISHLIKTYDVEVNIIGGGLDYLQQTLIGSLFIELSGNAENLTQALSYLREHHVNCEALS